MSDEEARWHVRIAAGEVKLLTLEQIDDLFRLDMIDENTLLRQDGTKDWLPLRVVAGLDEEEAAPAPAPLGSAPPPMSNPPPAPLPVSSDAAPVSSAPPPVRSAPPPPPAPLPPPSERAPSAPAPPVAVPFAHSPSFLPPEPSAPASSTRAPSAPAPSVRPPPPSSRPVPSAPPPSFAAPAVASVMPIQSAAPPLPMRASRGELLLIGLAVLLGLLVTLNRNGALATLFASAGQRAAYDGLEASLGGPGFGTPRAVDALVRQKPK